MDAFIQGLSDSGLLAWAKTLSGVSNVEFEITLHVGSDASRIESKSRPSLVEILEELDRRGLV